MKACFYSLAVIFVLLIAGSVNAQYAASVNDRRIDSIVLKLTLEEKISMLHANGIFTTSGVARLGIPELVTDDGPLGIREDLSPNGGWGSANLTTDSATFFPNGSAMAATFNPALAKRYGIAMGEEARARHKDVVLAPAMNITRTPINGRTYEYLSEDPLLNAKLAVAAVQGIQSQHVAACVKHYALNNQEADRDEVNVTISERALREIYLPAFKASITEGNAWTIMSAYNKFRGYWCSENDYLLQKVLRNEWKFKGAVISDWGGTHSTVDAANKGLDVEMGSGLNYSKYFFADPLLAAVKSGQVSEKTIDEKVRHILWVMSKTSLYPNRQKGSINTDAHSKAVYYIAAESIVLLKNEEHLLPLNTAAIKSIAVIGENAIHLFQSEGFGAGVKARYEINGLQGLQNALGNTTVISFSSGYKAIKHDQLVRNKIDVHQVDDALIAEAVAKAKASDIAILFIGGNRDYESESRDREDLSLPFGQQALVDAVTAANPNTIIVFTGGAPYDLNAINKHNKTIVWQWYNGSEGGHALADVLIGKINPSGKMPFTFPVALKESPAHYLDTYPGEQKQTEYKEGILVGYRWYDTKNIEPLYPFGYGLSYTEFVYGKLSALQKVYTAADTIIATVSVKNTGKKAGKETVQLYVSKPVSNVDRATKELKAFAKPMIAVGASQKVTLVIPVASLAYWNESKNDWVVEPGEYLLQAASSSKDIRAELKVQVK